MTKPEIVGLSRRCFAVGRKESVQSDHRDKNIPGPARVPYDLRFSLVFLSIPGPLKALVSYRAVLVAVAWLYFPLWRGPYKV